MINGMAKNTERLSHRERPMNRRLGHANVRNECLVQTDEEKPAEGGKDGFRSDGTSVWFKNLCANSADGPIRMVR